MSDPASDIGVVIIGRNEGQRLRRCLESVAGQATIVYVDSGSTDASVELARSLGAQVVELDMSRPFSAARARNAGLAQLTGSQPGARYVQFIDGDCELRDGWLDAARRTLDENPGVVAVGGRLRERHPEASLYNRLCDMEWNTPVGQVKYVGGIAMMRRDAVAAAGGFNEALVAGEEPELCLRLRQRGGRVLRIDHEMAWHDAAMFRFGQWCKRTVRSGLACGLAAQLHGRGPERMKVREIRGILVWALAIPAIMIAAGLAAILWQPWLWAAVAIMAAAYALLAWRVFRSTRGRGFAASDAALYAVLCVIAKWPQLVGLGVYWRNRLTGRGARMIEYKQPDS